jgi:cytochrome P450
VGTDGWREADLLELVSRCVFEAGVVAMFGRGPVDAGLFDAFVRFDRQFPRLVAGVPLRLLGTVRRDRDSIVQRLRPPRPDASAFIQEHRELLSRYVDDLEASHVRLSMLWASQANTIPAAFWAVALLLEHPRAYAFVRAEIDGDGRADGDPPGQPAHKLQPRLDAAILEMLRLCIGATTLRTVLEPLVLELVDGRRCALRPGDTLALFPYLSHRDPEVFDDPETYRHDRFLPTERGARQFQKGGQRLGFALMPFGGGETMCPGRFLAQSEIKAFVTLLLTHYELALAPGQQRPAFDLSRSGLGILPPVGPLRVRLRPRVAP